MSRTRRSWGSYPPVDQAAHPCHWQADVPALLRTLASTHGNTLAFGNGRSYGDSCLAASGHVIETTGLDRWISADWSTGAIRVEAGMKLQDVLALAVPRGWFLPVTPGTQLATVGGCVANDVHGKNHHRRGTFGAHVRRFALHRHGQVLECAPGEHGDVFAATIGGLGLTGVLLWVELQLVPVGSDAIDEVATRFDRLAEFFQLSKALDPCHEYGVAWLDCTARGQALGRGVYFSGDHAPQRHGRAPATRRRPGIPFTPPFALVNGLVLRAFNEAYWRRFPRRPLARQKTYAPFFYPLDAIAHWNRLYGRKGFQQYQAVVGSAEAMEALVREVSASGAGSFLAVLKRCGDIASPGWLSFPMPGYSLALDFPQDGGPERNLFPRLDAIVREAGGRLYPAKDAHMSAADFKRAYPRWDALERMRDPALDSAFWKRVTS
jgi:FAD/FMN-containing dehydrogenase